MANVVTSTDAVSSLGSLLFAELQITNFKNWPALLIIALSSVAAMLCLTHAYRTGQPVRLAPFEYFMIIISLIYGNLIWHDQLGLQEFSGIILIMLSGIYLVRKMP